MTMDVNPAAGGARFTVGRVISTGLSVVFANVFRFLVIMLAVGVPVVLLIVGGTMVMAAGMTSNGPGLNITIEDGSAPQILFIVFAAFLGVLAYFLVQSALTYGALQTLRGRPAGIGACISNGLAALPRVLLASLVLFVMMALIGVVAVALVQIVSTSGVATTVVSLALAAGVLFVITVLWVFVPAIVVERAGPVACFSRSIALTKGHRWGICAILILVFVANWIISFVSQALAGIAPVAGSVLDIAAGLFFTALGSVMAAVGYYFLRAEKEGVAIDDVVTVFD